MGPRRLPILLALAISPASVPRQQAEAKKSLTGPGNVAAGGRIFRSHCAECHGIKGEGGRGPNLTLGEFRHGSSDSALLQTISMGVPGSEMTGAFFTGHQLRQVVAFIRSLSARTVAVRLPGNPKSGQELFRGKGECSHCHLVNGAGGRRGPDLSDIGAKRSPEHLRTSILEPDQEVLPAWWSYQLAGRDDRAYAGFRLGEDTYSIQLLDFDGNLHSLAKPELREAQVNRKSIMPPFGHQLSAAEIDDIVSYLASLRRKPRAQ